MDRLADIYQEVILEHNKNPRNFCIPGWAWKQVPDDGKWKLYCCLNKLEDGYSLSPNFGMPESVRFWSDEEIYGPYEIIRSI